MLQKLEFLGVKMDTKRNSATRGGGSLHAQSSRVHLYVLHSDEELIVARQTFEFLQDRTTDCNYNASNRT